MKKFIVPVVTAIVALIVGVVIGVRMTGHIYDSDSNKQKTSKSSKTDVRHKAQVHKINQTLSNDTWNVTLDSVYTEKTNKKSNNSFTAINDFDIKKLLPDEYYMTTVEITLGNKTDKNIDGSRSSGDYRLVDGDGNSRGYNGTTLSSYTDIRPNYFELFPAKSKTKIQFVVLSDQNKFNSKNMKISIPDFAKGDNMDNVFVGGTFDFGK